MLGTAYLRPVWILALSLLLASPAAAQETAAANFTPPQTLKIALDDDYAP